VISRLMLDPAELDPDATLGLAESSHIEVVFHFHKQTRIRRDAAHPRGNPAWPRVGVLAGYSPVRPNLPGMSRCALLEVAGLELTVQGLDAIDGTPILDIGEPPLHGRCAPHADYPALWQTGTAVAPGEADHSGGYRACRATPWPRAVIRLLLRSSTRHDRVTRRLEARTRLGDDVPPGRRLTGHRPRSLP
jgi:tRNA (Thr-GGU) A37 N-methylase